MSVLSGGCDILSSSYILSENVPIPSIVCLSSLGESDPLILDELTLLTMIIKRSTIELLTKTLISSNKDTDGSISIFLTN